MRGMRNPLQEAVNAQKALKDSYRFASIHVQALQFQVSSMMFINNDRFINVSVFIK